MKVLNSVHKFALTASMLAVPCFISSGTASYETAPSASHIEMTSGLKQDKFVSTFTPPPPEGTDDSKILAFAPNPNVTIAGVKHKAAIVVDLSKNVLYKYDEKGKPQKAYLVASGKASTPTHEGVRIVTHIETYPYRGAPARAKRRRAPKDYGPKIICLNKIDTKSGEQSPTGEFIHGNNNPASIGKYASHGCVRMDNEVIKQLSQEVKRGDIVILKR